MWGCAVGKSWGVEIGGIKGRRRQDENQTREGEKIGKQKVKKDTKSQEQE